MVGIIFHVPYDMTNQMLSIAARLLDDDGAPALVNGEEVAATGEFEMGRPAGTKQGETSSLPMAMNFQGIVLDPGGHVFEVSAQDEVPARCRFRVT